VATGRIGDLPPVPGFVTVQRGDVIEVALAVDPDEQSRHGRIVVDVPELFTAVRPGERVLVDDGAIELTVLEVHPDSFRAEVLRPERGKVKAEKGINLPDTTLTIPALGPDDHRAIEEMAGEVDLFALSFVSRPADLDDLWAELDRRGAGATGVILKIEHSTAFRNLPDLLLHGLQRPPIAVMVARGDLAVEVGFERLAEVQEQILWVCEAAHVPVIWATQVLESLAKDGVPSRAEVTDAAWGSRAECVMLNKGPHITEAMRFLDDVFERMHAHQDKRTAMFRPLSIAATFGETG
jgi:pyruvate kinase